MADEIRTDVTNHNLISSLRVEGTPVFDRRGEKIGSIHSIMIDKTSGQAAYALMSFGGFMGFGNRIYPIPWAMLTYDRDLHGYSGARQGGSPVRSARARLPALGPVSLIMERRSWRSNAVSRRTRPLIRRLFTRVSFIGCIDQHVRFFAFAK